MARPWNKARKEWQKFTCPKHGAPIKYGTAGGWFVFRCGCEVNPSAPTPGLPR